MCLSRTQRTRRPSPQGRFDPCRRIPAITVSRQEQTIPVSWRRRRTEPLKTRRRRRCRRVIDMGTRGPWRQERLSSSLPGSTWVAEINSNNNPKLQDHMPRRNIEHSVLLRLKHIFGQAGTAAGTCGGAATTTTTEGHAPVRSWTTRTLQVTLYR